MNMVICFDWLNPAKGMLLGMCQLWSHLPSHIAISDGQGDWVVRGGSAAVRLA